MLARSTAKVEGKPEIIYKKAKKRPDSPTLEEETKK
jgi:hypothetical protein